MYTQCPECSTAFRVTAAVLKQAAGKVRCGGCGIAFNALAHLSEEKPASRPAATPAEPSLPELKPEPLEAVETPEPPPTAISPEQSAALLKTLDELAGSDIRLEDTGIEWRLLDEVEIDEAAPAAVSRSDSRASLLDEELSADLESRRVDEVLSNTPTPVDEYLPASGHTAVESPEVFDEAASRTIPDEELRFDDNTGLPDAFDEETGERPVVVPEPTREAPEPMANQEVDLGFGDPDEWLDLLDEVAPEDDRREAPSVAGTGDFELAAELEALEAGGLDDDDAEDEPEDDKIADDAELSSRMEALSIELSGIQEELDELSGNHGIIDAADVGASEPAEDQPGEDDGDNEEYLVLEADEDGDDILLDEFRFEAGDEPEPRDGATLLEAGEEADEGEDESLGPDAGNEDDDGIPMDELVLEADAETNEEEAPAEAGEDDETFLLDAEDDENDDALFGDGDDETGAAAEAGDDAISLDDDLLAAAFEAEAVIRQAEPAIPVITPLTEEEQTINMMIDQDLLSIAIEDEDGFTSTIVGDKASFAAALAEAEAAEAAGDLDDDGIPVETIIMEGAVARSGRDEARADALNKEDGTVARSGRDEPSAGALKQEAAKLVAETNAGERPEPPKRNWRLVAGIIALTLLLAVQAVHFSRDSLARVPAIYDLLAPVYDSLGMPLTPAWEVTGWRFEATRGSTDGSGETLSIFTRIGNESDAALPYPVISVSLTDRFEETIGSRVFEPPEYLAGDVDTRRLVAAGSTFDALMAIESPTDAATGFKLNVCYRLTGDRLRCAIEDFR
ncbi:MAG: DUF3426 domain-containing protein [Woeseiaceae bacterium]|jgi:predicted Zn finger-like uncharacterized protein|nr:DUF3426 domain-containing protein [Woeseiaceae bacterium]